MVINMKVIICDSYEKAGKAAATVIAAQVMTKPDCVLGLATGSTPLGTYSELIRLHKEDALDFARVRTFNLDEYFGVEKTNDQSYYYFMMENLFSKININSANINMLDGQSENPEEECRAFEERIAAAGGIDLQLLGIGHNGHIGFNEPGDCYTQDTHVAMLSESTIEANARFFRNRDEVPTMSLTMGIGSIMRAKKILLIASGGNKADIVREFVCGKVTPQIPASILKFHNDVIVILDRAAAAKLK